MRLTPHEIQLMAGGRRNEQNETLAGIFKGVNGHDVTDEEQLTNPGEHLLPVQFREPSNSTTASTHGEQSRRSSPTMIDKYTH